MRSRGIALLALALLAQPAASEPAEPRHGCVVWKTGPDGARLRPDGDRRHRSPGDGDSTTMTFTFDSPEQPWTAEERTKLQGYLDLFLPALRATYGHPAFSIAVNVVKDTTLLDQGFAGTYSPSDNVLTLWAVDPNVVCHELVHAFHDDDVVYLDGYEEGMAKAVEIKTLDDLGIPGWDSHHGSSDDTYYETLNQPELRPGGGWFWAGAPLVGVRYTLAGYLWDKVEREHPGFLKEFNRRYYALLEQDAEAQSSNAKLVALAAEIAPTQEGASYAAWAERQYVLGESSRFGVQLYQYVNSGLIAVFDRHPYGYEEPLADVEIEWDAFDADGIRIGSGSAHTDVSGFAAVSPTVPWNFDGRIRVWVRARCSRGSAESVIDRPARFTRGFFGLVPGGNRGSVTITPLDASIAPVVVPVTGGLFVDLSLQEVAGRFSVRFVGDDGRHGERVITKDASSYQTVIAPLTGMPARAVLTAQPAVTRAGCRFVLDRGIPMPAHLTLYDAAGRIVRVLDVPAGASGIDWNGVDRTGYLSHNGVILARLTAAASTPRPAS